MTPDKSINQATSSSAIGSSGGEHAEKPAPPSRGRIRCLKCRDQREAQPNTFGQCPVQWSIRKDAQNARKMVDAELPRADRASHVGVADAKGKCRAAGRAASVSHSASHVGGADGADDAQCKYQAVPGTAFQAVERTASQAVGGTASSSQVGGVNQWFTWELRLRHTQLRTIQGRTALQETRLT